MRRNRLYTAAKCESERLLTDAYLAADQQAEAAIEAANVKYLAGQIDHPAKLDTYASASDGRSAAYAAAEQEHRDRLAAIQRHFSQMIVARGNPDAEHARAFVETVADPEGLFAPRPVKPAVNATTIKFNGIKQRVFLDGHGRVIGHGDHAERPSPRGTFAGDFLDAKRAAVMPPEEPEAP